MLNIIIVAAILVALTLHRYLSAYLEQGSLPHSFGFIFFGQLLFLVSLVNFIWMFGAIAGITGILLCYFQVVYSAALWVFLVPWLLRIRNDMAIPSVNLFAYGGFSFLVAAIGLFAIINFFVSPYKSMWGMMGENIWLPILIFIGVIIVGNIARVLVTAKLMDE